MNARLIPAAGSEDVLTLNPLASSYMLCQIETRPCEVSGHQSFWRGTFHRFVQIGDLAVALVETEGGNVSKVNLQLYDIRFTDKGR